MILTAASPTHPFLNLSKSMKNSLILTLSLTTRACSLFSTSSSTFMKLGLAYWADGWKLSTMEISKHKFKWVIGSWCDSFAAIVQINVSCHLFHYFNFRILNSSQATLILSDSKLNLDKYGAIHMTIINILVIMQH